MVACNQCGVTEETDDPFTFMINKSHDQGWSFRINGGSVYTLCPECYRQEKYDLDRAVPR